MDVGGSMGELCHEVLAEESAVTGLWVLMWKNGRPTSTGLGGCEDVSAISVVLSDSAVVSVGSADGEGDSSGCC